MLYVATVLLIAQFALMWVVDASIDIEGLTTLAWAVWLVGVALLAASTLTLRSRGQTPEGRDFVKTEALVATGVYGLVRHPMYLGWALMHVAMILFMPNWLLATLGLAGVGCVYVFSLQEEARLEGKFGSAYGRYMQAVPRFNLVAGAIRLLRRRHVEAQGRP